VGQLRNSKRNKESWNLRTTKVNTSLTNEQLMKQFAEKLLKIRWKKTDKKDETKEIFKRFDWRKDKEHKTKRPGRIRKSNSKLEKEELFEKKKWMLKQIEAAHEKNAQRHRQLVTV
jgi:hypothetical protein